MQRFRGGWVCRRRRVECVFDPAAGIEQTAMKSNKKLNLARPDWLTQVAAVLDVLNEGVMIVDDCYVIQYVNPQMQEMTGYPAEKVVGRTREMFYSGEDLAFVQQQVDRTLELGAHRFGWYLPRTDGTRLPVVVSSRVVEDPEGRWFAIVTFTDVSELREREEKLREAYRKLEERQQEIERELAIAARVQRTMAPRNLTWGRLAVETYYLPVRTIGGDFCLVTPCSDTSLNLMVCDVSGHGIGSALIANRIYTEALTLIERCGGLEAMLHQLNQFVLQHIRETGFFFSLAAARCLADSRRVSFAGAGHPPGFWVTPAGELRHLETRSRVLGLLEDAVAPDPTIEVELGSGDRIVLYTDGLTEVFNSRGEFLSVEGLEEIVRRAAAKPLPEMKQSILDGVDAWRDEPLSDDVSLILVEFR